MGPKVPANLLGVTAAHVDAGNARWRRAIEIPGAIAEHLGLPREAAINTYERYAHLGAAGPITNFNEAYKKAFLDRNACEQGTLLALYAQGAGFTRGAALLGVGH